MAKIIERTTRKMTEAMISAGAAIVVCLINNSFQVKRIKAENKKSREEESKAIKLGIQALLRDRLYQLYDKHMEEGFAPIDVKENFENLYKQYHNLGENGVMDESHDKFKELPTKST